MIILPVRNMIAHQKENKMNEKIMRSAGFGKEVDRVKENKCPFCPNVISGRHDFKNDLSWREYQISGFCQQCQDGTFE